jgi:hypothetical protein
MEVDMGQVIALSGWKGSGKDFAADYLVSHYGFTRIALADILKEHVANMFGIPVAACHDRLQKEVGIPSLPVRSVDLFSDQLHKLLTSELASGYWTPRALCILVGSTCRAVDPDYWVRQVVKQIRQRPEGRYIITDMRYRNEAAVFLREIPNIVLGRVLRAPGPGTDDPSENDLNDYQFPVVLNNYGAAIDYYRQLDILVDDPSMSRLADGSVIRYGD